VAAQFRFKGEQQGIDAADSTEFGLAADFCTRDLARTFRAARPFAAHAMNCRCRSHDS